MTKKALVIGATGLIGRNLVFELLKSNQYNKVIVLARRDLVIKHEKLQQILLDFDSLENYSNELMPMMCFVAWGQQKQKRLTLNYTEKLILDYPLQVAKITRNHGATQYILVSSMGANKESTIFYSRLKGEIEAAIGGLGFPSFQIIRPSLLLGSRSESRPLETISQYFMRVLNPMFFGPLKTYRAIEGQVVAKSMLLVANMNLRTNQIWLNNQLFDLVENAKSAQHN